MSKQLTVPLIRVAVRQPLFIYHCLKPGCRYAASGQRESTAVKALSIHMLAKHGQKEYQS